MNGIERIKQLAAEVTNKPLLKVVNYLVSREDMNDKYLNEEKSLKQMVAFIRSEAKKQAEDGCAYIDDPEDYAKGKKDIYFMRLASNQNKSLVTIEVKDNKIVQKRIKNNDTPTSEQNRFLNLWENKILGGN